MPKRPKTPPKKVPETPAEEDHVQSPAEEKPSPEPDSTKREPSKPSASKAQDLAGNLEQELHALGKVPATLHDIQQKVNNGQFFFYF